MGIRFIGAPRVTADVNTVNNLVYAGVSGVIFQAKSERLEYITTSYGSCLFIALFERKAQKRRGEEKGGGVGVGCNYQSKSRIPASLDC